MRKPFVNFLFVLTLIAISIVISCKKHAFDHLTLVSTNEVKNSDGSVVATGAIFDISPNPDISDHGFCWNSTGNPTINNSKISLGSVDQEVTFNDSIKDLPAGLHFIKAFVIDGNSVKYGDALSITVPPIILVAPTSITVSKNVGNSKIFINSNIAWTASGYQNWLTLSKTSGIIGKDTVIATYTENASAGTRSSIISFDATGANANVTITQTVDSGLIPALTTNVVTDISTSTATSGGNITNQGLSSVSARGVCYSTSQNPTISNNHTSDGTGTGSYTSNLSGLFENTNYYVRAYAANSIGTSYGNEIVFTTNTFTCPLTGIDIDGNVYSVIKIGSQCWMKENLKTTKFSDGVPITFQPWSWFQASEPLYTYYNDNPSYETDYGLLYNYYAMIDSRNLCPLGWHIPNIDEYQTLIDYLGGADIAGSKMRETGNSHWTYSSIVASNISGFTALPSGVLCSTYGGTNYSNIGQAGYWWSSYNVSNNISWLLLHNSSEKAYLDTVSLSGVMYGLSVRCIKD